MIRAMSFGIDIKSGRPFGTETTQEGKVLHYTCNAPDVSKLNEYGIKAVGDRFGVQPREVLVLDSSYINGEVNTISVENFLAHL